MKAYTGQIEEDIQSRYKGCQSPDINCCEVDTYKHTIEVQTSITEKWLMGWKMQIVFKEFLPQLSQYLFDPHGWIY